MPLMVMMGFSVSVMSLEPSPVPPRGGKLSRLRSAAMILRLLPACVFVPIRRIAPLRRLHEGLHVLLIHYHDRKRDLLGDRLAAQAVDRCGDRQIGLVVAAEVRRRQHVACR